MAQKITWKILKHLKIVLKTQHIKIHGIQLKSC